MHEDQCASEQAPDLKQEQKRTLDTPVLPANFVLRIMYWTFDLLYGKARTLPKLKALEILARYPYWAWETGSYTWLSRLYARRRHVRKELADVALRHISLGRQAQDNEQWHMMLIEDIMRQMNFRQSWLKACALPRLLAFGYYYLTKLMYRFTPVSSFAMNAAFESHAEHEYMKMAQEHPEWEDLEVDSVYFAYYPRQKSLADLIRRIALDERGHMTESLDEVARLKKPRG